MRMLRSVLQMTDLIGPPWMPGPISKLGAGGGETFPLGLVGDDEALLLEVERERSKMRSFFSKPPVATSWGRGWEGNATARTM